MLFDQSDVFTSYTCSVKGQIRNYSEFSAWPIFKYQIPNTGPICAKVVFTYLLIMSLKLAVGHQQ